VDSAKFRDRVGFRWGGLVSGGRIISFKSPLLVERIETEYNGD
jgi:hypothetical protein